MRAIKDCAVDEGIAMVLPRYVAFCFIAFVIAFASPAAATAPECVAAPFVNTAGLAILKAARQKSAPAFARVAGRYTDLRGLAMYALGNHRRKLAKSREDEYVNLTRIFIGRVLAKNSSRFRANSLIVTGCAGSTRTPIVTARLSSGQKVVFMLYKTRKGFLVRDVSVASVWLGQQLKTTFTGVINRQGGSVEALLDYLRG